MDEIFDDDYGWLPDPVRTQVRLARERYGDDFDPAPLAAVHLIFRLSTLITRASMLELAPLDLTSSQFSAMMVLERAPEPMTMGQLAEAVSIQPANLTTLVQGLERRSLVERQVRADDGRSAHVGLTRKGRDLLGGFLPGHWRFMESLLEPLDPAEQGTLIHLLAALLGRDDGGERAQLPERVVTAAKAATAHLEPAGPGRERRGKDAVTPTRRRGVLQPDR
jgi:DNA-binding MarR family transcriptional regulator